MKNSFSLFSSRFLVLLLYVSSCVVVSSADERSNTYEDGEEVKLWANKIGPYWNTNESYKYLSLPFCVPADVEPSTRGGSILGEAFQGSDYITIGIQLFFKKSHGPKVLCKTTLNQKDAEKFEKAVADHYWYQYYFDELPMWGMLGSVDTDRKSYIFTHKHFSIGYHMNQVTEVNITTLNPTEILPGTDLTFSYSVEWFKSDIRFEKRYDKYLDDSFVEHQIHWFSILNSLMMFIFLLCLVAMILMRTLRTDYPQYQRDERDAFDDFNVDITDDSGWKQVHGDVFRSPTRLSLFSALIGTGFQCITSTFGIVLWAWLSSVWSGDRATVAFFARGNLVEAIIILFLVSAIVAGYSSGAFYSRCEGRNWIKTMLVTAFLGPFTISAMIFSFNFVALYYGTLAAIPFESMLLVASIWGFVSLPLVLIGTLLGRNLSGVSKRPCRVNPHPRHIPEKRWYTKPMFVSLSGGILPFGSIFIEMYFVFTSFWNYKFYYLFGFVLFVYIILMLVTMCISIIGTYFMLNAEEYRWQWVSFASSASTSIYVFLYSLYYFVNKTRMSGIFQTLYYFTYTSIFCLVVALITGTLGFVGSALFVRRIYKNVKVD